MTLKQLLQKIIVTLMTNRVSGSSKSYIIWEGTQAQYEAISSHGENTIYYIYEE